MCQCRATEIDNTRRGTFTFDVDASKVPCCMHGLAGYFEATLYKSIGLSTVPARHTEGMHSWFPLFFPLQTPLLLRPGDAVSAAMWRHVRGDKVCH